MRTTTPVLLGAHLHVVVGAKALYGYEVRAGVFLGGELLATGDADTGEIKPSQEKLL